MNITIELVTIVGAAIAVAIGIVLWVFREFTKRDKEIVLVKAEAVKEIAEVKSKIGEYKLHVSETYATKEGVNESFQQVMRSIDRLSDRINRYFEHDFHDNP